MRITIEFENWDEMETFRTSGKKTRSKKEEAEEVAEKQAQMAASTISSQAAVEQVAQSIREAQPVQAAFAPPVQTATVHNFPGGNGQTPSPGAAHPLVAAILARIDGAVSSGQPSDAVVTWFRQQIGPEAAQATLDQIKQIFIPRMTEAQLKQIAPQLGIQG